MSTATIVSNVTAADMAILGHSVYSSAMRSWALITNNDDEPSLLVLFREGGTVYRYAFRDWDAARTWDRLRMQDEEATCTEESVSWGRCFHHFLTSGAILPIAA